MRQLPPGRPYKPMSSDSNALSLNWHSFVGQPTTKPMNLVIYLMKMKTSSIK
jgi:hypothetical protein